MKIIGKVSDSRFIAEVSADEMRMLGALEYNFKFEVGGSVDVHENNKTLQNVKGVTEDLEAAIQNLDKVKARVQEILKRANKALTGKVNGNG